MAEFSLTHGANSRQFSVENFSRTSRDAPFKFLLSTFLGLLFNFNEIFCRFHGFVIHRLHTGRFTELLAKGETFLVDFLIGASIKFKDETVHPILFHIGMQTTFNTNMIERFVTYSRVLAYRKKELNRVNHPSQPIDVLPVLSLVFHFKIPRKYEEICSGCSINRLNMTITCSCEAKSQTKHEGPLTPPCIVMINLIKASEEVRKSPQRLGNPLWQLLFLFGDPQGSFKSVVKENKVHKTLVQPLTSLMAKIHPKADSKFLMEVIKETLTGGDDKPKKRAILGILKKEYKECAEKRKKRESS